MTQAAQLTKADTLTLCRRHNRSVTVVLAILLPAFVAQLAQGEVFVLPLGDTNGWQFLHNGYDALNPD